jgi:hypothetical protein
MIDDQRTSRHFRSRVRALSRFVESDAISVSISTRTPRKSLLQQCQESVMGFVRSVHRSDADFRVRFCIFVFVFVSSKFGRIAFCASATGTTFEG